MKILFLAAEATPWVKIGGLADVAGELPPALKQLGVDVRLAMPYYPHLKASLPDLPHEPILKQASIPWFGENRFDVYLTTHQGLEVLLIDGPPIQTPGPVYGRQELEAARFSFFSLAVLAACEAMDWRPGIVHANDWHTALSTVWLAQHRHTSTFWREVRSVLSIHNLPYMGPDVGNLLAGYSLSAVQHDLLPDWSKTVPLPMGIASADQLTTVSPTYADEIQTSEFGRGMEALLSKRRQDLKGILNGIDHSTWNPAADTAIARPFDLETLDFRVENKKALLDRFGLAGGVDVPLVGMITRMDYQKGVELAVTALRRSADLEWQALFLGKGDPELEAMVTSLAAEFPDRTAAIIEFDPDLARQMYAGLDMILIPSRYEPCGLAQMIGMRYGCIPIVRTTGGLVDTVSPYKPPDQGTGFRFEAISSNALAGMLDLAFTTYQQRTIWQALQIRAMQQDFSWGRSAKQYTQLYQTMVAGSTNSGAG